MIVLTELSEDINTVIDAINDGKHGIIHPQVLTPSTLINELRQFEKHYNMKYSLALTETNYENLIDISEINVAILKSKLVYSIHLPVVEDTEYIAYRLIPIPKKSNSVFLAIIFDQEYILLEQRHITFIPIDENLLKLCKKLGDTSICKRKQPWYLLSETSSCVSNIRYFVKKLGHEKCRFSPFKIETLAYILLHDETQIIIPEDSIQLDCQCESKNFKIVLNQPMRITSNESCIISGLNIIIRIQNQIVYRTNIKYVKNMTLPFKADQLDTIKDKLLPLQREVHPTILKQFSQTLDNIENAMNKVKLDRRTKSWIEKTVDSLTYIGYVSSVIITLIILYKFGALDLIIKCFPKKICFFCVKTKVSNNPPVQYSTSPIAPSYSNEKVNIPLTSTKSMKIKPK